jgi:hypothetical protein
LWLQNWNRLEPIPETEVVTVQNNSEGSNNSNQKNAHKTDEDLAEGEVKFSLQQATKAQGGGRGIALLFP